MTIVTPNNINVNIMFMEWSPSQKKNGELIMWQKANEYVEWPKGRDMDCKAIWQNSWGDENILYLDHGGSFTGLYNSQNSRNCIFYMDSVYYMQIIPQ